MSRRNRTCVLALGTCLGAVAPASAQAVNLAEALGNSGFEADTMHSQWRATRPTVSYLTSVPVNPVMTPLNPARTDGTTLPALNAPAGSNFAGVRNVGELDAKGKLVHSVLTHHFKQWTVFRVTVWANRGRCCNTLNPAFPSLPGDLLVEFLGWGSGPAPAIDAEDDWSVKPAIRTQAFFSNWGNLGQWTSQTLSFTSNVDLEYITLSLACRNHRSDSYVAFDIDPAVPSATDSPCGPSRQFAVFSVGDVEIGANAHVAGGLIGSARQVLVGHSAVVPGVRAERSISDPGDATYNGDLIASKDVSIGSSSVVYGSVHAARDVFDGEDTVVNGSLFAGRNVSIGNAMRINGNIHSGKDVFDGVNATINGRVESRNRIVTPATVTGTMRDKNTSPKGSPEPPLVYSPVYLSPPTSFVTGLRGDVVTANGASLNLAPGYYGHVALGPDSSTTLTGGQYYLASLKIGTDASLHLNMSGGPISILVDGDVDLLATLTVTVNDRPVSDILGDARTGNLGFAELARSVYLETRGSFQLANDGQWFGAVSAPLGRITLGENAAIVGALAGGDRITVKDRSDMFFIPSCGCILGPTRPSVEGSFD